MYPLGHMGVSYFLVYIFNRFIKEEYNAPFVMVVSLLPDIDLLFTEYISHRGITHSIIIMTLAFFPVYLYFRKGLPCFIALLSHSLVGDYFTGYGIKLFWPIVNQYYRAPNPYILNGNMLILTEFTLFLAAIVHLYVRRKNTNKINVNMPN